MSSHGTFKNEILEELKNTKHNDLEDLVYRYQITYDDFINILDLKIFNGSTKKYTLVPSVYEVIDNNFMLESLLSKEVKVNVTIDDVRLKPNLATNKTIRFSKKSFFDTVLGFIDSDSGELGDIEGFVQLIPATYKSDERINITGMDKVYLKCDCIQGSIVNGVRESILYSFGLSSAPGHKIFIQLRIKLCNKIKKIVLSRISYYLEDDVYKPIDFNGETIRCTRQLIKI